MARSTKAEERPLAPPRALLARVRRFALEHDLLPEGGRVLVGVSGGPDSTCLLLTLAALRRSLGFELHAAYFDHQLRGERGSAREERYVARLAEALGVPLHCGSGDVRAHAQAGRRSLEEAARELRYRFLAEAASASGGGCSVVAVGHTLDDQAETVLLHLLRGSGLRGLAAMAPSSAWPVGRAAGQPRLVRPLLELSRARTEACCRQAGLTPLRDPSNRSGAHLRNRIRQELLPLLRRYNPRIETALSRLAEAASGDIELLEALASGALAGAGVREGEVRLDRRALGSLASALQRHAVRLGFARLVGDARGLSDRHVRGVLRASEGPTGARLDLARCVRADVRRNVLVLTIAPPAAPRPLPEREAPLPVPGQTTFGRWRVEAKLLRKAPPTLISHDGLVAYVDADACDGALRLRRRRPGDRFHPLGLGGPKKLQDFFVDAHVAREERDAVPLVCCEQGIAWVVGHRPADWAKLTPATRRVLRLRAVVSEETAAASRGKQARRRNP